MGAKAPGALFILGENTQYSIINDQVEHFLRLLNRLIYEKFCFTRRTQRSGGILNIVIRENTKSSNCRRDRCSAAFVPIAIGMKPTQINHKILQIKEQSILYGGKLQLL
jgi:hypothetical protein